MQHGTNVENERFHVSTDKPPSAQLFLPGPPMGCDERTFGSHSGREGSLEAYRKMLSEHYSVWQSLFPMNKWIKNFRRSYSTLSRSPALSPAKLEVLSTLLLVVSLCRVVVALLVMCLLGLITVCHVGVPLGLFHMMRIQRRFGC